MARFTRAELESFRDAEVPDLLDPDVERILSLRPDLVVLYNTQVELKQRLEDAEQSLRLFAKEVMPEIRGWNADSFEEPARALA